MFQRTLCRRLSLVFYLVPLLASCGAPQAGVPGPTTIPGATALARVFEAPPTPTAAETTEAVPSIAPTATQLPPTPTVLTPDPLVLVDCRQPEVQTGAVGLGVPLVINLNLDATPTGRTISPLIYGLGTAPEHAEWYRDMGIRFVRWGGNHTTRHNWEINASNAGSDWHFANVPHGWPNASPGAVADDLVRFSREINTQALLTIPTIGYVASDGDNRTRSTFVPEDGAAPLTPDSEAIPGYNPEDNQAQTSIKSFAKKGMPFVSPPDPNDGAVYQDEWVHHIVQRWGPADQGGLHYYALDNEPDLWSYTHRDVHPSRISYDGMVAMWEEYADAIASVDPSAQIVAPVLSGVTPMFYSSLDRGGDNFQTAADRQAHGNQPFLRWFLEEARIRDKQAGRRRLHYVDVHYYPQSGVFPSGSDPAANARRLRSTQELWNPDYTSESWIARTEGAQLALIPRLRDWVASHYPGTKIAITEWNFGADDTTNGGLTIVDALGIFGREGVDMASYWYYPEPGGPGASAFKLYGNYDSCGRHFGDEVLSITSSDEQSFAAYASRDSHSGDVLVTTVNKLPNKPVTANVRLNGLGPRTVQVYQFNQEHTELRRLPDVETDGSTLSYTVPPYAATLFVFKP